MDRSNLVSAIAQAQQDIQQYRTKLVKSEYLTRKVLIDPVLEALGYSILGSGVAVEYPYSGQTRADYALWSEPARGKPACLATAKKLGDKLEPAIVSAADRREFEKQRYFTYYFAMTDGDIWKIYDTSPGKVEDNLFIELRISRQSPSHCAAALERLAALLHEPNLDAPPGLGWIALADFTNALADAGRPTAIYFPDGEKGETRSWYHIVEHTARWLWASGRLTIRNAPILVVPRGTAHIVNTSAECESGAPWVPIGNGELFVSKQGGKAVGSQSAWERAKTLLEACNADPGDVYLQAPLR